MRMESDGHSRGNPRLYELFENAPKTGKSPTVWAFPELVDFLKVAGQPVQGPWPPHQRPRPDPTEEESVPVAIPDPAAEPRPAPRPPAASAPAASSPAGSAPAGSTPAASAPAGSAPVPESPGAPAADTAES